MSNNSDEEKSDDALVSDDLDGGAHAPNTPDSLALEQGGKLSIEVESLSDPHGGKKMKNNWTTLLLVTG